MFKAEQIKNPVVEKLIGQGVTGFINITPLDDVPVKFTNDWKFKPTCMPDIYINYAEQCANFKVREDDVWIVTYPKCGTTWTQEMTWMIMNNLNFEEANSVDITKRSIFFEFNGMAELKSCNFFKALEEQKSPRVIKSHLPIGLLPRDIWVKKCKIIYVTRDPKDVAVSFFHHFVNIHDFKGSIENFTEAFVTDQVSYSSFWNHILEFWMLREKENILFLKYEDMKKDFKTVIEKTCTFLQKDLNDQQISELMENLSFEKMKASPTRNNQGFVKLMYEMISKDYNDQTAFQFMRKGQAGGYIKELPQSCIDMINEKTKKEFLSRGLTLYSLL